MDVSTSAGNTQNSVATGELPPEASGGAVQILHILPGPDLSDVALIKPEIASVTISLPEGMGTFAAQYGLLYSVQLVTAVKRVGEPESVPVTGSGAVAVTATVPVTGSGFGLTTLTVGVPEIETDPDTPTEPATGIGVVLLTVTEVAAGVGFVTVTCHGPDCCASTVGVFVTVTGKT